MEQSSQEGTQQEESRRTAAKAFMESLDQLGKRLQSCEEESAGLASSEPKSPQSSPLCPQAIEVDALEDAAADIEQFMQMLQTKNVSASGSDGSMQQS
jgi:hypothetical protein